MCTLAKTDLETILTNILGDSKFELISYEQRNASDDISQGFLSAVLKVTIYYKVQNVIEKCSVFIKREPVGVTHNEEVCSMGVFQREVHTFTLFLKEIGPGMNDFFPSCYLANNDTLVLEDLSVKGYRNLEIFEPHDKEHCLKVADCLVKLHAASFIFEKKMDLKPNELIPDLEKELIYSKEENHVGRKRHLVGVKALRRFAEVYLTQYSKDVLSKAFDFLTVLPEKMDPSTKHPNTLCHSDLWNNNIMFSYDSNGKVKKACLVDFQMASYRPPTFDLQIFLYCCTNQKTRRKHLNQIKKYYFEHFQDYLRQADLDPDSIISWEVFESMYEETLPTAMGLAQQYLHFAGLPAHLLKPIMEDDSKWKQYYEQDRNEVVLQAALESLPYRQNLTEGLDEFINYFLPLTKT